VAHALGSEENAMPFGAYKTLPDLARAYQVALVMGRFVVSRPHPVNEAFAGDLDFVLQNLAVRISEASIRELMIAPVLKEVWKAYSDTFLMWVNVPFGTEEPLLGTPDYYFSRKSPLGLVPDQPYLILVEAKKDDFEGGWAQCLAAMLAAQKMNKQREQPVFGCVSNGSTWTFGKLDGSVFTQELEQFSISRLPELFGALHFIFARAKEAVQAPAA
jgi:hypothetical protein